MKKIFALALTALMLTACGTPKPAATEPPAAPVESALPETTAAAPTETTEATAPETEPASTAAPAEALPSQAFPMDFMLEGMTETVDVQAWWMGDSTICIPAENWIHEPGGYYDRWINEYNDEVRITVYHYSDMPRADAVTAFVSGGRYVYEDLLGGGSAEDCLTGDSGYMRCSFFCTENGVLVAWEYPAEASEGFGSRMAQMAATLSD